MTMNIKNERVVRLAEEVAQMTGESKTEAIGKALEERKHRLSLRVSDAHREQRLLSFLEREIWSRIPPAVLGKQITKVEEEEILGYGPDGDF